MNLDYRYQLSSIRMINVEGLMCTCKRLKTEILDKFERATKRKDINGTSKFFNKLKFQKMRLLKLKMYGHDENAFIEGGQYGRKGQKQLTAVTASRPAIKLYI